MWERRGQSVRYEAPCWVCAARDAVQRASESAVDFEDFNGNPFTVTIKPWRGPFTLSEAKTFLAENPGVRAGVYIIAMNPGGRWVPIKVGETEDYLTRVGQYERNPNFRVGGVRSNPLLPISFFFGPIASSRLTDVQNALSRLFLRLGYTMSQHDSPKVPARVNTRVEIKNALPPQFQALLGRAYTESGTDKKGYPIRSYPSAPAAAAEGRLVLTPSGQPVWEI